MKQSFAALLFLMHAISHGISTPQCSPKAMANSNCTNTTIQPTNTTTNNKPPGFGHPSTSSLDAGSHAFFIILYLMIFIIGVSGNSLVCYALGKKRQLRKGDIFIISLAIADLIACFIWPLHMVAYHSYVYSGWFFEAGPQSTFYFIFYTTLMVSSWQLLLISIDRYWAIKRMLHWKRITMTKKLVAVLCSWVLAACIKFPLTWRKNFGMSDEGYKVYLMVWTCLGWVIPLIIIAVMYGICIKALRDGRFKNDTSDTAVRRRKENERVVKMFVIIVSLFFIFTIPHSIIDLFRYIDNKSDAVIILHECSVIVVLLNSCTNPFIYARMHRDMNSFVRSTWRRIKGKRMKTLDSSMTNSSQDTIL